MTKKNLYIIVGVVVAILFVVFVTIICVNIDKTNKINELKEIRSERSTDFIEYESNLSLAKSYLSVYDIIDESSYQTVKNDMYNHFSDSMQKEIFPTVNYEGISLHPMETQFISCVGTNNKGQENVFKLVYRLTGVNYDQEITNLITITNGVISRVERIK